MGEFDEPFLGSAALADRKLTAYRLRKMRRLHRDVYIDPRSAVTAMRRAKARTVFDLARWLPLPRAVEQIDALCRTTRTDPQTVLEMIERYRGTRGVDCARAVLSRVDPGAESLPETRVRLLLIDHGLPAPETQLPIFDGTNVVAWADMGWKQWRTAVEYDGIHHWVDEKQRTRDIERYDALAALGWKVVRVNSEQLRTRPRSIVERVRRCLRDAGAPV